MNTDIDNEFSFKPLNLQSDVVFGQINELMQKKEFAAALSVVQESDENFSDRSEYLLLASQVYRANEQFQMEANSLQRLIEIQKKPRYLTQLAEALTHLEDFPQALKVLHQVIDESDGKDPILFEVYKNMGNIYLKCGDIEAAEEKYNLANAIDSHDENLMVNYGVLSIQKGDYETAKAKFAEVIERNDTSDLAWVGLALVHRSFSDHDLSRACLLRGLDENPYNKLAITNLYQWGMQDGVDLSTNIIDGFMEKFPQDVEINKLSLGMNQ